MMKKNILFILTCSLSCVSLLNCGAKTERYNLFGIRAWELALNPVRFDSLSDDQGQSVTTLLANGTDLGKWLENKGGDNAVVNVDIIQQNHNGSFSLAKKLGDFDRSQLVYWYKQGTDADGNLIDISSIHEAKLDHLALIQAIKMGRCVLCEDGYTTIIVVHAKEEQRKVCDKLERSQAIQGALDVLKLN